MVKCCAVVQGKIHRESKNSGSEITAEKSSTHTIRIKQFIHHTTGGYTQKLQHGIKKLG